MSGVVGSVLLLGAGLLTYDVERDIRRDRVRRRVENLMFHSLSGSLADLAHRMPALRREIDAAYRPGAEVAPDARSIRDALRYLTEELRHWQVVSLTLAHGEEPRSAELVGRQLVLANQARGHLVNLARSNGRRQAIASFSNFASVLSDMGANHELLCWATQENVNLQECRRSVGVTADLNDSDFIRAYGTFRSGLGGFHATGTPGIEPALRFYDAAFDPREHEWQELIEARHDAADRLRAGSLGLSGHRLERGASKPLGGGVLHAAISRVAVN
ncbi:hypothetical protein [Nocardioides sp. OK12]|uniref:hypothetical protein n=1 Tax=Nocardioides sp. OK12 TaxID=2758661 RepID=UPI0021C4625F|nr:hypothetical protein [Nocardioides sp. OK12]